MVSGLSGLVQADLFQGKGVGTGALYEMTMVEGGSARVSIYLTPAPKDHLGVEYFIETVGSLLPVRIWQQFTLEKPGGPGKSLELKTGYIKVPEWDRPETLTGEFLKGADGVQMNDFLFQDEKQLDRFKVGDETLTLPVGKVKTAHYRQSGNDQTIDYWIAEEAKPVGLVKLVSKGKKGPHQNYNLVMLSLLKNVKPVIDAKKSVPLSDKGRSLLQQPLVKN